MSKGIRTVVTAEISPEWDVQSFHHGAASRLIAGMRAAVLDTQPPHCYTEAARMEINLSNFNDF